MSGHAHSHDHGHSHADHAHCQPGHPHRTLQPAVLGWAMVFTLSLVVAEVFGGIFGRSVALLNDAVHNLSDVPALGISCGRPSKSKCDDSRRMPTLDQSTSSPMPKPRRGSIQCAPVFPMRTAPTIMAMLESASPKL